MFEALADGGAVQGGEAGGGGNGLVDGIDDEAGFAVFDDFGDGAAAVGDDGATAGHGFDHDEAEGFGPGDGEEEGFRAGEEGGFVAVVNFADELDVGAVEQRGDDFFVEAEVFFADLGGDFEFYAAGPRDADGVDDAFFGGDAAEEGEVVLGCGDGFEEVFGHAVQDGDDDGDDDYAAAAADDDDDDDDDWLV